MNQPPTKMPKIDDPVVYTPRQLHKIEQAAVTDILHLNAEDPFSLVLLEAVKTNNHSNFKMLWIDAKKSPCSEFLDALVNVLVTHPIIPNLEFVGTERDLDIHCDDCTGNDYTALIAAIAESQCLLKITMSYNLPWELEEAIMEALKQKSALTTLYLCNSELVMKNPDGFGDLLASSKGLGSLHMYNTHFFDDGNNDDQYHLYDASHIQDGLRESQSLKEIKVWGDVRSTTYNCIMRGLDGNQSLERLDLQPTLQLTAAKLLCKIVSNHDKLAFLRITDPLCNLDDLCDAISQSTSMTEFRIHSRVHASTIVRMLQQTTSLQKLLVKGDYGQKQMNDCANAIKECKTLTSFVVSKWIYSEDGIDNFLEAALVNRQASPRRTFGGGVGSQQTNRTRALREPSTRPLNCKFHIGRSKKTKTGRSIN